MVLGTKRWITGLGRGIGTGFAVNRRLQSGDEAAEHGENVRSHVEAALAELSCHRQD